MSKRRSGGRCESTSPLIPLLPAQQYKATSEELDILVDSFIDLIIDGFIDRYRSGQLDTNKLKKKGGNMFNK
jgi:hypothetical protein